MPELKRAKIRHTLKFICTKYGWMAERIVNFINDSMGGIFGQPVVRPEAKRLKNIHCIIYIFDNTGNY